uniref:Uncharacterized protein n=1 Tax=Glossina austeni TaxID=7395 RepID=A0A1A9VCG4_GLOAU
MTSNLTTSNNNNDNNNNNKKKKKRNNGNNCFDIYVIIDYNSIRKARTALQMKDKVLLKLLLIALCYVTANLGLEILQLTVRYLPVQCYDNDYDDDDDNNNNNNNNDDDYDFTSNVNTSHWHYCSTLLKTLEHK